MTIIICILCAAAGWLVGMFCKPFRDVPWSVPTGPAPEPPNASKRIRPAPKVPGGQHVMPPDNLKKPAPPPCPPWLQRRAGCDQQWNVQDSRHEMINRNVLAAKEAIAKICKHSHVHKSPSDVKYCLDCGLRLWPPADADVALWLNADEETSQRPPEKEYSNQDMMRDLERIGKELSEIDAEDPTPADEINLSDGCGLRVNPGVGVGITIEGCGLSINVEDFIGEGLVPTIPPSDSAGVCL